MSARLCARRHVGRTPASQNPAGFPSCSMGSPCRRICPTKIPHQNSPPKFPSSFKKLNSIGDDQRKTTKTTVACSSTTFLPGGLLTLDSHKQPQPIIRTRLTPKMPLDTSSYSLALLRVDGRRWNELRRCHAQIRTQAAADGSSYLEMGNTKVMCVVTGPTDQQAARRALGGGGGAQQQQRSEQEKEAEVAVSIVVAGFSSVDRKRRGRNDK